MCKTGLNNGHSWINSSYKLKVTCPKVTEGGSKWLYIAVQCDVKIELQQESLVERQFLSQEVIQRNTSLAAPHNSGELYQKFCESDDYEIAHDLLQSLRWQKWSETVEAWNYRHRVDKDGHYWGN